jgi:translation initiation factor IF-3
MNNKKKLHLINREIRANEVRVTDSGIMSFNQALSMAESQNLDLVLINDKSNPPICKIMNYEKFIYELNKKPKNKVVDVKEIKIGPNTSDNDLSYRVKQMIEFLNKGHKVKITMQFRGREMVYLENGQKLMLKMIMDVQEHGIPEAMPKLEGKKLFVVIKPKNK